jgi:hypothetical protein
MSDFALTEGRFEPVTEDQKPRVCPPSPTRSVSSTDAGYLSEDSANCSLAEALKDHSDFHFDMSDRWRQALVTTLEDPIYPETEEIEEPAQSLPLLGLGLQRLFFRAKP